MYWFGGGGVTAPVSRQKDRGWKTVPAWNVLTSADEAALPVGTRLGVLLGGVTVPFVKTGQGRWQVESRGSVPANKLVGRRVAPRVRRGTEQDPDASRS